MYYLPCPIAMVRVCKLIHYFYEFDRHPHADMLSFLSLSWILTPQRLPLFFM